MNNLSEKEIAVKNFGYNNTDFVKIVELISYLSGEICIFGDYDDSFNYDRNSSEKVIKAILENNKSNKEYTELRKLLTKIFNHYASLSREKGEKYDTIDGNLPETIIFKLDKLYETIETKYDKTFHQLLSKLVEKEDCKNNETKKFSNALDKYIDNKIKEENNLIKNSCLFDLD